jgi:DNA invertase Pin-like site-specific DNA recombinase
MKTSKKAAALYMRLSRDDEQRGESTSITNQRKLLKDTAAKYGYTKTIEYVDDGYSGTTFDRPGFMKMEQDITEGKINCVIVKDQSRLGRHQLKVGSYVGIFFFFF